MKVSFKFWLFSTIVGTVVVLPVFLVITFANAILRCFPCFTSGCEDMQHNNNTMFADWASVVFRGKHLRV
jgi:hypothetical protein